VRLFESVLMRLKNAKKPRQKFLCHVMRLLLLRPGHVTFRNLSRYSLYHEQTFARWFVRDFDFVSFNHAAIVEVVAPSHEHVLAFEPRFVPKSGSRPLVSIYAGTVPTAGRTRAWRLPRWRGSMAPITAPMPFVWPRLPPRRAGTRHRRALIPICPISQVSSQRSSSSRSSPWWSMAISANSSSSMASAPWICPWWVRSAAMPTCGTSTRGHVPAAQGDLRSTMGKSQAVL